MYSIFKKNIKTLFPLIVISLLLILATGILYLIRFKIFSSAPLLLKTNDPNYFTVDVVKGDIIKTDTGAGTIVPVNKYDLYFDVSNGNIKKLYVEPGEIVNEGELLAELDYGLIQEQIKEQEINLEIEQLNYEKLLSSNPDQYEIKEYSLHIESIKLDIEYLKKEFEKKKLISPVKGVVTYRINSKLGGEVKSSDIIYSISGTDNLQIQYFGKYVWDINIGKKVLINYKDNDYTGEVISPPILFKTDDSISEKYYYVNIKFNKAPKAVKIGDNVNINIEIERKKGVLKIPKSAIKKINGQSIVTVLEKGNKISKQIETGLVGEVDIEITKGLSEGEKVILN